MSWFMAVEKKQAQGEGGELAQSRRRREPSLAANRLARPAPAAIMTPWWLGSSATELKVPRYPARRD
jgi:hypothetical protein